MALSQKQVSQLYVAIFGRASEGEGNKAWSGLGLSMAETATKMLETDAANDYFGGELSNQDFIEFIYLNTLGKTLEQDPDGIAGWVQFLNDGMSRGEVAALLIEAIMLPENDGTPAQQQFINRVEISNYMANNVDKTPSDWKTSTVFTSPAKPEGSLDITSDKASVEAAKKAIDEIAGNSPVIPGETKYLTVGQDILTGTDGNDKFVAVVGPNQNGQEVNFLASGDDIKGGAGYDTLDAKIISAYNLGGSVKDVTPITKSVENIILHAELNESADSLAEDVTVNAKYMEGVEKIASNYSDASLVVKNMTTKDVSGGTAAQTIAMEYTGNRDTNWKESDMTVYYDQDYLTRDAEIKNGIVLHFVNVYEAEENTQPLKTFEGVTFKLGNTEVEVDLSSIVDTVGIEASYNEVVKLINAKFEELGLDTASASINKTENATINSSTLNANSSYYSILLENDGEDKFTGVKYVSNSDIGTGARYENTTPVDSVKSDTPVSINVDLEKVGLAADGGALVIGSMNKDTSHDNEYGLDVDGTAKKDTAGKVWGQGRTTTETVAGFDEFNVTVYGDKTKNSSLSALHSTNNSLRKVKIDSEANSVANLTIGNSNTVDATDTPVTFGDSKNNAFAFKDVQIMDASAFKGDLVLNAGFTKEIVAKYLINVEGTTVYGLDNPATELALFDYKGGSGDDVLNLALNFVNFGAASVLENVFKMDIDGGAGDDVIIIAADDSGDAAAAGDAVGASNITINGGAGDDLIYIGGTVEGETAPLNNYGWTFNVAFDGPHFGHDTIVGFDTGAVALTDEAQKLDLKEFTAHAGEVIKVTVGNVSYNYTVKPTDGTSGNMTNAQIATKVAALLTKAGTPADVTPISEFFTTAAVNGSTNTQVDLAATDKNVNSVTVEIISQVEAAGTYDKDTKPIHEATSVTTNQGGILSGLDGADTLDFSAYKVKGVVIEHTTDIFGTNAGLKTTAAADIFTATGEKFIYLEASAHDADIYNVYMATSKAGNVGATNVDVTAGGNATKDYVIGSINLQTAAGVDINLNTLYASQLLF